MLAQGSHADDIEGALVGLGLLQGLGVGATLLGFTLESKVKVGTSGAFVSPRVGPSGVSVVGSF